MRKKSMKIARAGAVMAWLAFLTAAQAGTNGLTADYVEAIDSSNTNYFLGKVGVGTNAPSSTLHVVGDLTVSGAMTVPKQGDLEMGGYTNGVSGGGISTPATTYVPAGYISGCWPSYVDTNTVSITNGDGYCYDKYFCLTSAVNVDITSFSSTAWDWHYIYLDYSASTFPNALSFYTATNEPVQDAMLNGCYHPSDTQDRLIGCVMQTNTTAALLPFFMASDGTYSLCYFPNYRTAFGMELAKDMNPSGYMQAPNLAESSSYLPVCAVEVLLNVFTANSSCRNAACSYEEANSSFATGIAKDSVILAFMINYHYAAYDAVGYKWVNLGSSRNVRIGAQDADANLLSATMQCMRMKR